MVVTCHWWTGSGVYVIMYNFYKKEGSGFFFNYQNPISLLPFFSF